MSMVLRRQRYTQKKVKYPPLLQTLRKASSHTHHYTYVLFSLVSLFFELLTLGGIYYLTVLKEKRFSIFNF